MSKIEFWMLSHKTSIFTACCAGFIVCAILLGAMLLPAPYGQQSNLEKNIAHLDYHVPRVTAQVPDLHVDDVADFGKKAITNYINLIGNLAATLVQVVRDDANPQEQASSEPATAFPGHCN